MLVKIWIHVLIRLGTLKTYHTDQSILVESNETLIEHLLYSIGIFLLDSNLLLSSHELSLEVIYDPDLCLIPLLGSPFVRLVGLYLHLASATIDVWLEQMDGRAVGSYNEEKLLIEIYSEYFDRIKLTADRLGLVKEAGYIRIEL